MPVATLCWVLATGASVARSTCAPIGGTRTRTLAYVVTACHRTADGTLTGKQSLMVQQGACAPQSVMEFSYPAAVQDSIGVCPLFGALRLGWFSVAVGVFQRLGVSPDGTGVVFEVTNAFTQTALLPPLPVPEGREGIYYVRADGSGLRRLGPPSREAAFRIVPGAGSAALPLFFPFSPDGTRVVFTDRGPGPSGEDAIQVAILDIATGERTFVTHLPDGVSPDPTSPYTGFPGFVGNHRVSFGTLANADGHHPNGGTFTVGTDGHDLRALNFVDPQATGDSRILPTFQIVRPGRHVVYFELSGTPINPQAGATITEVFLYDPPNLLQLTNFSRGDTIPWFLGVGGRQVFFTASADPLGTNPTENCQLFSVGTIDKPLRQLTNFSQGGHSALGCGSSPPPGCTIAIVLQDPVTRTLVFYSSCDPFGTNPSGAQVFAMRPNGTRLRQLTQLSGTVHEQDGSVSVELPGPIEYSGHIDY